MFKGIYQCCYTNTETAGWMPVAVSTGIPSSAAEYCLKQIHGKNSQIDNTAVDEKGKTLRLFECDSDGDYLYMTYTQYGLISRNRPSMFSHTYVFPWTEELIVDPNRFLTLKESNFVDNEESALTEMSEPDSLESFSVEGIINKYNLTKENLMLFIGVMINHFSKRKDNRGSIYIQYDGTDLQIRELLFLIYKLIPRFMRKEICAASCDCSYTREKPLIFSIRASGKKSYVDVFSGKSNVLDELGLKKLKRSGYPVYACERFNQLDINKYFADLEDITEKITGNTSANRMTLQVCHKICTGVSVEDMDENSAIDHFYDVLGIDSQTEFYFDYLARCFKKAVACSLTMNDAAEKYLIETVDQTKDESELRKVYRDYEVSKVSMLNESAAVEYLRHLDNSRAAAICRTLLEQDPSGKNKTIVSDYYKQIRLKTNTFDGLSEVIGEMLSIPGLVTDQMTETLKTKASDYYFSYIFNADTALFEKYKDILRQLYNDDDLEARIAEAKEAFWQKLTFKNVKFDKPEFYALMSEGCETIESILFERYIALPGYYLNEGIAPYIGNAYAFFNLEDFKARYSGDGLVEAISALVRYLTPLTNDGGARVKSYTNIATVDTTFGAAVDAIVDLLEKVDNKTDYQTITMLFKSVTETIRGCAQSKGPFVVEEVSTGLNTLKVNLTDALIAGLRERDESGDTVPLDLWLNVGKFSVIYSNPFRLLEHIQPCVLKEDKEKVVRENTLMLRSDFLDDAKKYIQSSAGGNTAEIVKEWIKLYQNSEKIPSEPMPSPASAPAFAPPPAPASAPSQAPAPAPSPAPAFTPPPAPTSPFAPPTTSEQHVFSAPTTPAEKPVCNDSSYQDFTSGQPVAEPKKDTEEKNPKKGLGGLFGGFFKK